MINLNNEITLFDIREVDVNLFEVYNTSCSTLNWRFTDIYYNDVIKFIVKEDRDEKLSSLVNI